jgi:hypothetical protein
VKQGVTVNANALLEHLKDAAGLISGEKKDLFRYGRELMERETDRAFRQKVDPQTGGAWPQRKGSYPWPMLNRTGTLRDSLRFGYGIKTKNKRPKFFGKVTENSMYGFMSSKGKFTHPIVIAGSVHFGRSKGRSDSGSKLRTAPKTGRVPPRPIFGFGRAARNSFKRNAERRLRMVFK